MKRIALLMVLSTIAILSTVEMRGENMGSEHGSIRSCYSPDSTMVYRYYDDYMFIRQANKRLPENPHAILPYWFQYPEDEIMKHWIAYRNKNLEKIQAFYREGKRAVLFIRLLLKTGQIESVEIRLSFENSARVEDLPLQELFSIYEGVKLNTRVLEHEPCEEDNKYATYLIPYR